MTDQAPTELMELRRKAEANLGRMIAKTVPSLAPENVEALVHELRVHQIELQLQCEELRQSRQEAEESRDRYRDLYESAPGAYLALDLQGRVLETNAAGERLLGVDRATLKGKPFAAYVTDEEAPNAIRFIRATFESGWRRSCETVFKAAGKTKTVLIDACVVGTEPEARQLCLAVADITERKEAEDRLKLQDIELREQRADLQALNSRLLSMEENLRRRIARDLQEEYSQRVSVLTWKIAAVAKLDGLDAQAMYKLDDIRQQLSHLSVNLHHLAHRLHSQFLEHCDLHEAMKEYIDELNQFSRPQIEFQSAAVPAGCRDEQAVALFRVLQEALANVSQHAKADQVAVTLHPVDGELVLMIRDTGNGFDSQHRAAAPAGFGLIIMRERLRAAGGRFSVESRPGQGTTIRASVPLAAG